MSYSFSDKASDSLPQDDDDNDENTIKILVATDCHIGYAEKDGIRHSDSLNTFEEILQQAKKKQVDMILLGGDLFHENKPSRKALHGVMALIRKYCMGDRPVQIQFLSDQSLNFAASPFPVVNYEDPNINIEIPVFSIHGNHDDPAGLGNLCSLDILSVSGLVNYFGKCNSLESIEVTPLLIQKGTTRLALYGIGSIRDERMHRIFVNRKIKFFQPKDEDNPWFNLLVLHQNRTKHGETNYIPEQFLPDFLDLVLWGHEHECKIDPVWNDRQHFFLSQPGSSIATSLCQGEAVQKHICLLKVRGKALKCSKIRLETVRPFYMRDISLLDTDLDPGHAGIKEKVEAFCSEKVEGLISLAEDEHTGNPKQPQLPLVRLRVDYSGGFETFNVNRFGQRFVNRVANTKDIVLFHRRKLQPDKRDVKPSQDMANYLRPEALDAGRVEDLVKQYFSDADEHKQLSLLSEKGLGQAIQEFVDKEERDAINELVKFQLDKTRDHLKKRKTTDTFILEEVKHLKVQRKKMSEVEQSQEVKQAIDAARQKRLQRGDDYSDDTQDRPSIDSDDSEADGTSTTTSSTRGRGRGAGGGRGRGRGQGSAAQGRGSRGRRAGNQSTGGRAKQSVLSDSFIRASKPTKSTHNIVDSDDSEDDSMSSNVTASSASNRQTSQRNSKRSVVQFLDSGDSEDGDDFDDFPISSRKNKSPASKRGRRY